MAARAPLCPRAGLAQQRPAAPRAAARSPASGPRRVRPARWVTTCGAAAGAGPSAGDSPSAAGIHSGNNGAPAPAAAAAAGGPGAAARVAVPAKAEISKGEKWWLTLFWGDARGGAAPLPFGSSPLRQKLYESDPSLNQSLISEGTTISQLFDQDKWEFHRQVGRYGRDLQSILSSTVFRRILKPVCNLAYVAAAICGYNLLLRGPLGMALGLGLSIAGYAPTAVGGWVVGSPLPDLGLHLAPFTLLGPVLGLLLIYRTNSSYARFSEGRLLWGSAVRHVRDVARIAATYMPPGEAREHFMGYLVAWGWLLKAHLRSGRTRQDADDPTAYRDDPSEDVRACLPAAEAEQILAAVNRPYVAIITLTAIIKSVRATLPNYAVRRMEDSLVEMGAVTGGCERILSTPMPLSYTRFTGRALMIWLCALPLALCSLMGWSTVPVIFAASYLLIGIDECGVEIEEPFCILPLKALCDAIKRDVGIADREAATLAKRWPAPRG